MTLFGAFQSALERVDADAGAFTHEALAAVDREVARVEADAMGCHIITAPADVLKKLPALGTQSPAELSLSAVKAFRDDAVAVGLTLDVPGKMHAAE